VSLSNGATRSGSLPIGDLSLRPPIRTGPSGSFGSLKACSDTQDAATAPGSRTAAFTHRFRAKAKRAALSRNGEARPSEKQRIKPVRNDRSFYIRKQTS
jgi:hypothetical protein